MVGGTCIGEGWLKNGKTNQTRGPDFVVNEVASDLGPVSVYVGCCSDVGDHRKLKFVTVPGASVWRTSEGGHFSGYLIRFSKKFEGEISSTEYHFFGKGLADDKRDVAFFKRLTFRGPAITNCKAS